MIWKAATAGIHIVTPAFIVTFVHYDYYFLKKCVLRSSLLFFFVFLTFATVGIPAAFAYCAAPLATNVVGHIRPSGSSPTADAFARRAATRIGFFISDVAATAPYLIGRRRKKW